jgi:glutathione S-transferase
MLVQQDQSLQAAAAAVLDKELQWLVDSMHPEEPFALGQQLGLVDCAIAPFLIRLFILEHYRCASTPDKASAAHILFFC